MPRGDGTGPMGMGSMTGRAAGRCAGYGMPGYASRPYAGGFAGGFGRGGGFGGGGRAWMCRRSGPGFSGWAGFGRGAGPYAYAGAYGRPDPETESQVLRDQADALRAELDFIEKRLSEMSARSDRD